MDYSTRRGKVKGSENRDNNKKFSLLCKSSGLIPLLSNPGIGGYSIMVFVGKGAAPLVRQIGGGRWLEDFFPIFLGLMGCVLQVGALWWSHHVTGL
jgi:nitrate reductase NapE component